MTNEKNSRECVMVPRDLLGWQWWGSASTTRLYLYCLLKANPCDENINGETVERGSFYTSRAILASETGLTEQQVRDSLERLEKNKKITSKRTNKRTKITLIEYDGCKDVQPTKEPTGEPTEKEELELKKSETYRQIVEYYNGHAPKELPRVRKIGDKLKRAIDARLHAGYSVDDIQKAISLMNTLNDFYKGHNDRHWTADLLWLMQDTKGNFTRILEGGLHVESSQKYNYELIMNGGESQDPNEYRPIFDDRSPIKPYRDSYFFVGKNPQYTEVPDGYNADTRPDGALLYTQYGKFRWSKEIKYWKSCI